MKQKLLKSIFSMRSLVLVIATIISGYLVWNTTKIIQKNYGLQQEIGTLQEEVKLLELENENLKLSNEYYKTDEYLELEAKRKSNLVGKGEHVLILPGQNDRNAQSGNQSEPESLVIQKSNFQQWMDFLRGRE